MAQGDNPVEGVHRAAAKKERTLLVARIGAAILLLGIITVGVGVSPSSAHAGTPAPAKSAGRAHVIFQKYLYKGVSPGDRCYLKGSTAATGVSVGVMVANTGKPIDPRAVKLRVRTVKLEPDSFIDILTQRFNQAAAGKALSQNERDQLNTTLYDSLIKELQANGRFLVAPMEWPLRLTITSDIHPPGSSLATTFKQNRGAGPTTTTTTSPRVFRTNPEIGIVDPSTEAKAITLADLLDSSDKKTWAKQARVQLTNTALDGLAPQAQDPTVGLVVIELNPPRTGNQKDQASLLLWYRGKGQSTGEQVTCTQTQ